MKFSAFGPFLYSRQTSENTVALFNEIDSAEKNLDHGVGLYFFFVDDPMNQLTPCYVGLSTTDDFGARICTHLNKDKFIEILGFGRGLKLYLLAAVSENGALRTKDDLDISEKSKIRELERGFIGAAAKVNERILNLQGRKSQPITQMPCLVSGQSAAECIAKSMKIEYR